MNGISISLSTIVAVTVFVLLLKLEMKIIAKVLTAAACLVIAYLLFSYLPIEEWLQSLDAGMAVWGRLM